MSCDQAGKERMIEAAAELMSESSEVEKITVRQIAERAQVGVGSIGDPVQDLKELLQSIQRGELQAASKLIPLLHKIYGNKKEEQELKILALQMIQPLQFAAVSPEAFRIYSGVDLYEEAARIRLIDTLVDNLITRGRNCIES